MECEKKFDGIFYSVPGYNRAAAKGSNLKECFCQDLDDAELDYLRIMDPRILKANECVCQDLDDAELDYLGIIEPRQRARILAMAELLFDSDREQEDEEEVDDEVEKGKEDDDDDEEGGFDRTCLR
jgi:hypothetical protein